MSQLLTSLLYVVGVGGMFLLLIGPHEAGHFLFAKLFKVRVIDPVIGVAVIEEGGHDVRSHEREGQERAGSRPLARVAVSVLDRAVARLARVVPPHVLLSLLARRRRLRSLHGHAPQE